MSETDRPRRVDEKSTSDDRGEKQAGNPAEIGADRDMEAAMSRALAPVVARAVNGEGEKEPKLAPIPPVSIDQPKASDNRGDKPVAFTGGERPGPDMPRATPGAGPGTTRPMPAEPVSMAMPPPPIQPPSPTPPKPASAARPAGAAPAGSGTTTGGEARGASMTASIADMPPPTAIGMRPAQTPPRNLVYDHLVEGDDDVIGLITYSLYKKDKRDWIIAWRNQHGTDPSPDQVEAFVAAQMTFAQRDRYRTAARQVLDAYASVAVEMEKPLIVREGIAGRVDDAVKRVESSGRWWRQFPAALLGGMLATAILVGAVAILVALDIDIAGYLGFDAGGANGVP
jgi:hypothetical protein